jgi:Rod binding domain-containing protein
MRIGTSPMAFPPPADLPETKLREAAMDFEALLIAQVLHSFRGEAEGKGLSGDSSSSSSTMMEFAEQHLAQVMSRQGGLGLHELIIQGLSRQENSAAETQAASGRDIVAPTGR